MFEIRFAACECIKAYTFAHLQIRHHFLRHAINVHASGEPDSANIITALIAGGHDSEVVDPYRLWFATVIIFNLLFDDSEAKEMLMNVVEGDAESGEEVVTCIQICTGNLVTSLQNGGDERISIAYLMLLCGWLFEDASAVNDFLEEGSSLKAIIHAAGRTANDSLVIRGLCATLLGIAYEFSTKDSPIPRRQLQPLLTSTLGREKFLFAVSELRQHPLVRDFEVLSQEHSRNSAGLPEVFFDATFVEFLKDYFSRLSRSIDRDPGIEIHLHQNEGIDRDLVDELRGQVAEKTQALQKAEADLLGLERQLNQAEAELKKSQETTTYEVNRIKNVNDALQKNHDSELQRLNAANRRNLLELEARHNHEIQNAQAEHLKATQGLQAQLQKAKADGLLEVEKAKRPLEDEIVRLKHLQEELQQKLNRTVDDRRKAVEGIKELQVMAQKSKAEHTEIQRTITSLQTTLEASEAQITSLKTDNTNLQKELETLRRESQDAIDKLKLENEQLRTKSQNQIWAVKDAEEKVRKAEAKANEKEEERKKAQGELDDMLMVLADLEEKRSKDKVCQHDINSAFPPEFSPHLPFQGNTWQWQAKNSTILTACSDGYLMLTCTQARLKELGEEVSDGEDDDEEEDDEDDDEDVD
jgi:intracellular protein transport protein USO1